MEFFYRIGMYEDAKILGSNLYYTQDEFDCIINKIRTTYDELEDDWEDKEYWNWKMSNEIYGWQDYLIYYLNKEYGIVELDISAKEE